MLDWIEVEARMKKMIEMSLININEQRKNQEKTLDMQGSLLSRVDQKTQRLTQVVFYKEKSEESDGNIFNFYQEKIT